MDIEFKGVIREVYEPVFGISPKTNKAWYKQEFLIEEIDQRYPSMCVFQVWGEEKLKQFDIVKNEILTAHLSMKVNKTKDGKTYNVIDCWKVDHEKFQ